MDELMITAIDGGNSEAIIQALLPMFGGIFLVLIAMHLVTAWLISRIAKKNGYPSPWLAYVPIAQFSVLLSLGGQSGKHVFWIFLPLVGMLIFLYFLIIATINLCTNNGESKHFVWVLASPFVGLWGLYRLGNPGGGISLNKNQQALVQTCSSLIQQGKTEEEILGMMMQAGVSGGEVKMIYDLAKSGTKTTLQEEGSPTRKPLSGKVIAGLFILGFVINSIVGTVFGAVFGGLFNPGQLELEKEIEQELSGENLWDETVFETEDEIDPVFEDFAEEDSENIPANTIEEALLSESEKQSLPEETTPIAPETKQGVPRGVSRVSAPVESQIAQASQVIDCEGITEEEGINKCFISSLESCTPSRTVEKIILNINEGTTFTETVLLEIKGIKNQSCEVLLTYENFEVSFSEEMTEMLYLAGDSPEKNKKMLTEGFSGKSSLCKYPPESILSTFTNVRKEGFTSLMNQSNCSGTFIDFLKETSSEDA